MPLLFTDSQEEIDRLVGSVTRRFGWPEAVVRDMALVGSVAQVQDKLGRLRDAAVDQVFIPTFLPPWNLERLDRFITEVAPTLR